MDKYYMLYFSDNCVHLNEYTKEQLEKEINTDIEELKEPRTYLDKLPDYSSMAYDEYVIIKGNIVTPKIKNQITKLIIQEVDNV